MKNHKIHFHNLNQLNSSLSVNCINLIVKKQARKPVKEANEVPNKATSQNNQSESTRNECASQKQINREKKNHQSQARVQGTSTRARSESKRRKNILTLIYPTNKEKQQRKCMSGNKMSGAKSREPRKESVI
ncbi:hypothetical protein [Companilactobacillus furfuricola]|uniref:hypothetical protein n=1 Tax=Companilactobacillus furfuricola TaxID=1462575 RepID=UPI0013DE2219|nr:hypothetical protein [Companilactobacillus furfuricola]